MLSELALLPLLAPLSSPLPPLPAAAGAPEPPSGAVPALSVMAAVPDEQAATVSAKQTGVKRRAIAMG